MFSVPVCSCTRRTVSSVAPVRRRSSTIASCACTVSTVSRAIRSPKRSRTSTCSTVAASSRRRGIGDRPCSPAAVTAAVARSRTSIQSVASEVMSISSTCFDTPAASVLMISAQSSGTTVVPMDFTYARAWPTSLRLTYTPSPSGHSTTLRPGRVGRAVTRGPLWPSPRRVTCTTTGIPGSQCSTTLFPPVSAVSCPFISAWSLNGIQLQGMSLPLPPRLDSPREAL
mmetsp:Transcript_697/g.1670  ORF Transcript_697/g.1670 Transcript_697/m.1670 type:complete len:227 (-) Transcript_697:104-784(-)